MNILLQFVPHNLAAKGGGESGDKGGAGRVSFTGFSFVLLLASMMFN